MCIVVTAIAAAANARDDPPAFIERFAGAPYTGPLKVRIVPPRGKAWTQRGHGSAQFVPGDNGRTRLIVFGAIDDTKGDAGFAIDGRHDGDVWRAESGDVRVEIRRAGKITGSGDAPPQRFDLSGAVSPSSFDLTVKIGLVQPSRQGLPAGTVFRFAYDLSRTVAKGDTARGRRSGTCRKIRYEMRPVANIGDGSMSMLRVPVCLR